MGEPFNVLSLFAGIGGFDLGLERAGMTVIGQVEINPFCQRVLARHWPEVPRHDDVRTCVDWWRSVPRPRVDLVAGGPPCQPFSSAGRRRGVSDERWLWPAMATVVRGVRPRYVLVENVDDLVRDSEAFGWVLGDLSELGFNATGRSSPRAPWVPHTHGTDCSLWPTPTAAMGRRGWSLGRYEQGRYRKSVIERVHGVIQSLGHWRPPVLMIERLMGLPDGWLRPAETPSSPRSPSTSDG